MAITSRAPRFTVRSASTGPDLTSYSPKPATEIQQVKKLYAPFSSIAPRKTGPPDASDLPGPGSYNVSELSKPFHNPRSPFLTSAPRDIGGVKASDAPGPGTYSPHDPPTEPRPQPTRRRAASHTQASPYALPASIPSRGASGFVEREPGVLVPHPGDKVRMAGTPADSPGPGHYGGTLPKSHVKGAPFSRAPPRPDFLCGEKPSESGGGGGADDSYVKDDEPTRPSHFFMSSVPRDALDPGAIAKLAPGPGHYNVSKYSDFKSALQVALEEPNRVQAFSSLAPRKLGADSTSTAKPLPGPGAYSPTDAPLKHVKGAPFGRVGAPRGGGGAASTGRAAADSPATLEGLSSAFRRAAGGAAAAEGGVGVAHGGFGEDPWKPRTRLRGAFGSSMARFTKASVGPLPITATLPHLAPGAHNPSTGSSKPQRRKPTKVARAAPAVAVRPRTPDGPPPGAYFKPTEWVKQPFSRTGGTLTSPRFESTQHEGPGPGSYTVVSPPTDRKAQAISFGGSSRFVPPRSDGPGPGAYATGRSLIKRSFNITVGDSWD